MDLFKTFWRLCIKSSDWWAKEKECNDSWLKRDKSSDNSGDEGPDVKDCSIVKDVDRERLRDGLREFGFEDPPVPSVPLRTGWD